MLLDNHFINSFLFLLFDKTFSRKNVIFMRDSILKKKHSKNFFALSDQLFLLKKHLSFLYQPHYLDNHPILYSYYLHNDCLQKTNIFQWSRQWYHFFAKQASVLVNLFHQFTINLYLPIKTEKRRQFKILSHTCNIYRKIRRSGSARSSK